MRFQGGITDLLRPARVARHCATFYGVRIGYVTARGKEACAVSLKQSDKPLGHSMVLSTYLSIAEYVFTNPDTETRYTDIKKILLSSVPRSGNHEYHLSRLASHVWYSVSRCWRGRCEDQRVDGSIVTTMCYIHATDQGKRGAITVLSDYRQQRQKRRHKFVTNEKRQALQPAASH